MSDKEDRLLRSQFDAWIQQPENLNLIERLVVKNIEAMIPLDMRMNLPVDLSELKKHKKNKELLENTTKDVLNELIVTLLQKKELQQKILEGKRTWFNYIKKAFINGMKESNRNRPWVNLYRNANRILLKSDKFTLHKGTKDKPQPLAFSLVTDTACQTLRLEQDDFRRIPFPRFDSIYFEEVNTKKRLIPLAEYFLEQAALLTARPEAGVYLKDFISWITCNVEIFDPLKKKSGDAPLKTKSKEGGSEDSSETLLSIAPSANDDPAEDMDRKKQKELIPGWAENFANSLDEMGRKLFYYFYCLGLKHQELADCMNSKSNLTYHLNKVYDRLKIFLRPLPWLSPEADEGIEAEASQLFIESLCRSLKKTVPTP